MPGSQIWTRRCCAPTAAEAAAAAQLDQELLTSRDAIFGSAELKSGFKPVQSRRRRRRYRRFEDQGQKLVCAGYVSPVPSYSFTWTGKAQALRLYFEARKTAPWQW